VQKNTKDIGVVVSDKKERILTEYCTVFHKEEFKEKY